MRLCILLLGIMLLLSTLLDAKPLYDAKYLKQIVDTGDRYFKQNDYIAAFSEYKKALEIDDKKAHIHYRMGRVYGFLEPTKKYADREYALALHLWMKEYLTLDKLDINNLRSYLKIPGMDNPIRFIKRDIDKDGQEEFFICLKRGSKSFVVYAAEYYGFDPEIHHLATFYEGDDGTDSIEFLDLNGDSREEIIVTCNMKDFFNVMIFTKNYHDEYVSILNELGVFKGTYIISDALSGGAKEIEVFGKIRGNKIFDKDLGPYLSNKTIYKWENNKYKELYNEVTEDYIFVLNSFLNALMLKNDFSSAYKLVDPEFLLGNFLGTYGINTFKEFLRKTFAFGLAENGASEYAGKVRVKENLAFNVNFGWEEGNIKQKKFPIVRDNYKSLRLFLDENKTFLIEMQYKGGWKVVSLKHEKVDAKGWYEL